MKVSLLRKFSIVITSLVASSTAFGAMDLDSRVTQLENQMQQVRTETAMGTYGPKTASARPEINGYGWMFAFDVLYWRPKVGGTEFAYTRQSADLPLKGRVRDVDFRWNWGLRLGLGYNVSHDAWDFKTQYTWFDTKASGATRQGVENSVVPLRASSKMAGADGSFQFCSSAKSEFGTHYKDLALELGRAHFMSKYLSFRPHWGLKTARVNQSQVIRYTGGDESKGGLGSNTVEVTDSCGFRGLGPRVGLDSKWHLGSGVSLFGNVNGSLVFGTFDVKHKEQYSGNAAVKQIDFSSNDRAFSPTTHMHVGLRYDTYLQNCTQHLGLGFGFEAQHWWKQSQMFRINSDAQLGADRVGEDFNSYGMTMDVKWNF